MDFEKVSGKCPEEKHSCRCDLLSINVDISHRMNHGWPQSTGARLVAAGRLYFECL